MPRAAKVDREGLPGAPETRFPTISGRFSADFQGFSRLRRAIDLACSAKGRTSVFTGRRGTKQRFRILRKSRKSMKIMKNRSNRPAGTSCAKKHRFFRSRWWIDVDFNCLGALPDASGHPKSVFFFQKDIFGDSPGAPGTARVASKAPPSRSRHALGDLRASQEGPGIDFDSILDAPESPGIGFTPIFALSLLGKPLENSPRMPRNIL